MNNKYLLFICTLIVFSLFNHLNSTLFAQTKTKKYIGSSQFFDIAGEWINKGDTTTKRITQMAISTTIVNTYRIRPYFKVGKKELPIPSTPIQVSEVELCYTGLIADAKCFIVPTIIDNIQYLKVYSVIIDAAGRWTGMGIDILERKEDSKSSLKTSPKDNGQTSTIDLKKATDTPKIDSLGITNNNTLIPNNLLVAENNAETPKIKKTESPIPTYTYNPKDLVGHWKNEWQYEQIITRLQVVNIEGRNHFKVYRLVNDRERLVGTMPVIGTDKKDHAQITEFQEGELKSTYRFRPIILDNQLKGIDLTIEEFYTEGAPKGIFRQFFVLNPVGDKLSAAEELIKQLEGEWENIDAFSPTARLIIHDGESEVWAKSDQTTTVLGKKPLGYVEGQNSIVGTTILGSAFRRKIEIDTDLQINTYLKKTEPQVMVITSHIEDIEGIRPTRIMTEVFRRKGIKIPPEAFGINPKKK